MAIASVTVTSKATAERLAAGIASEGMRPLYPIRLRIDRSLTSSNDALAGRTHEPAE
jgi:hypothetical protein